MTCSRRQSPAAAVTSDRAVSLTSGLLHLRTGSLRADHLVMCTAQIHPCSTAQHTLISDGSVRAAVSHCATAFGRSDTGNSHQLSQAGVSGCACQLGTWQQPTSSQCTAAVEGQAGLQCGSRTCAQCACGPATVCVFVQSNAGEDK